MSITLHGIGILMFEVRPLEEGQNSPEGFSAHHTDNARYFLIITLFPLARVRSRRGL